MRASIKGRGFVAAGRTIPDEWGKKYTARGPVDARLRTGLRRVELDDATASLDGIEQALVVRQLQDLTLDRRLVRAVHARHVARHACMVGL